MSALPALNNVLIEECGKYLWGFWDQLPTRLENDPVFQQGEIHNLEKSHYLIEHNTLRTLVMKCNENNKGITNTLQQPSMTLYHAIIENANKKYIDIRYDTTILQEAKSIALLRVTIEGCHQILRISSAIKENNALIRNDVPTIGIGRNDECTQDEPPRKTQKVSNECNSDYRDYRSGIAPTSYFFSNPPSEDTDQEKAEYKKDNEEGNNASSPKINKRKPSI